MYILGLNAYHGDSSACIYKDGHLIAATEEERIRRVKHWAGLPIEAIRFCLDDVGIGIKDVDFITISRDPKANLTSKLIHSFKKRVSIKALLSRGANSMKINRIGDEIAKAFNTNFTDLKAELQFIEHNRSHMASSFHISPFEKSAILSIDGMGDFTSTMRGTGEGNKINVIDAVNYPHSLGIFYTTLTQYLGFPNYGDEYKVMGLSPYGNPKYADEMLEDVILLKSNGLFELNGKYFKHFKEGVSMSWEGGSPDIEPIFGDELVKKFGPVRKKGEKLEQYHMDLAASIQKVSEKVIFHLAEDLHQKTGLKNICITGGCAQNSVANGKLIENTSFENLFVPPAGHDAGTATGSALYYYHHVLGNPRNPYKPQPYTGIQFSEEEIEAYLKERKIDYKKIDSDEELYEMVANQLVDAGVVGWYQGRAEFGPRALGNRSILMDPRRNDAKEILNIKIKKRESFRPFAPSILKEYVHEYFEQIDDVPFMEKVFDIHPAKHETIPAVTHVNGTGRLQTVEKEVNPRYHALITKFYDKTGVPILLNTSFNENEPIVNTPEHALECYLRTKMDMLVLGNCVVSRNGKSA